jgi:hypothetical protein
VLHRQVDLEALTDEQLDALDRFTAALIQAKEH